MKKNFGLMGFLLIALLAELTVYSFSNPSLHLSPELTQRIGSQIWWNECGGKFDNLTTWNEGEEFASLGIGHFIWCPEGKQKVFKQSFPSLLAHFNFHGVSVPPWLNEAKGCPWKTREEFYLSQNDQQMVELRQLLAHHIDLQTLFMIERLQKALPIMLKNSPQNKRRQLRVQFDRLTSHPAGLYALLDYLNFKGEGINKKKAYQGYRWGLMQVLDRMNGTETGRPAVEEFVMHAKEVLTERVQYSPLERQEQRWLKGWYNRLDTYLIF